MMARAIARKLSINIFDMILLFVSMMLLNTMYVVINAPITKLDQLKLGTINLLRNNTSAEETMTISKIILLTILDFILGFIDG